MRVILDSSVWLAGIGSKTGYASEVIDFCYRQDYIELFTSPHILDEVQTNLEKKFDFESRRARWAIKALEGLCAFKVKILISEIEKIEDIIPLKDKHILALVEKINPDYLITFDRKHLLSLKKYKKTQILEPKDFMQKAQGLGLKS